MTKIVDFYFDFISPFSYLANYRLNQVAQDRRVSICYHAIDLAAAKKAIGNIGPSNRELPVKLSYLTVDLMRWAEIYRIDLRFIPNFNSRSLNVGSFFAKDESERSRYVNFAFGRTWGVGQAPDDVEVLSEVASEMQWNKEDFFAFIESPKGRAAYEESTEKAIERKVFGVPFMCVDDKSWWGNDRIFMLEDYLERNG
ncbi:MULTISPECIES: 2-hydroxychromene-2-carboxylate isomerase [unclassified Pseudomonas]|uniref:2-hydroxychromene-2-carboxylate isomerase n=1 Tax=unclassified Pseudomonas TaxID=196821 RepID=UPI00057DB2AC|nr:MULTISPECIES: 2-hydroxychromene-2-carboxylate isomerase [unclassified Pseudomonas]AMK37582.1 2-hydroxychromene 2-carboxylate isomerase [Pseudomonas sp. C5pp]KIC79250.1 2-hydroxychromene-2-carboxylate isomerase [Pseudomonas sp. C5pp]